MSSAQSSQTTELASSGSVDAYDRKKAKAMGIATMILLWGSVGVRVIVSAGAVVVMGVAVDNVGLWRRAAAVDRGAVGDFELDGGVVDAEVIAELVVDALENGLTLG